MLFAFVDESYDHLNYHMAAVVIPLESVPTLDRAIADALAHAVLAHQISPEAELHGYELMSGVGHWEPLRGQFRAASGIYRRALTGIHRVGAKVFIRGVDITRLNARYRYPDPPHQVTLQHVLEQVDIYATRLGETVTVIADECPDQARHAQMMEMYAEIGTPGFRRSTLDSIRHPILFADSRTQSGLQAVDLVAYLYRRFFFHEHKSQKAKDGVRTMWKAIEPAIQYKNHWVP